MEIREKENYLTILAGIDSARLDLDPDAEPSGTVRVGEFATGIRVSLLPIVADLAEKYPNVEMVVSEYEPIEAVALLTDDDLDLALTYDYNLAPASPGPCCRRRHCGRSHEGWASPRILPTDPPTSAPTRIRRGLSTPAIQLTRRRFARWRHSPDSRPASRTRSTAWIWWRTSSSPVTGSACCRSAVRPAGASKVLPISEPEAVLTAYAVTRQGRATWPPLRVVLDRMRPPPGVDLPRPQWPRPEAGE